MEHLRAATAVPASTASCGRGRSASPTGTPRRRRRRRRWDRPPGRVCVRWARRPGRRSSTVEPSSPLQQGDRGLRREPGQRLERRLGGAAQAEDRPRLGLADEEVAHARAAPSRRRRAASAGDHSVAPVVDVEGHGRRPRPAPAPRARRGPAPSAGVIPVRCTRRACRTGSQSTASGVSRANAESRRSYRTRMGRGARAVLEEVDAERERRRCARTCAAVDPVARQLAPDRSPQAFCGQRRDPRRAEPEPGARGGDVGLGPADLNVELRAQSRSAPATEWTAAASPRRWRRGRASSRGRIG